MRNTGGSPETRNSVTVSRCRLCVNFNASRTHRETDILFYPSVTSLHRYDAAKTHVASFRGKRGFGYRHCRNTSRPANRRASFDHLLNNPFRCYPSVMFIMSRRHPVESTIGNSRRIRLFSGYSKFLNKHPVSSKCISHVFCRSRKIQ